MRRVERVTPADPIRAYFGRRERELQLVELAGKNGSSDFCHREGNRRRIRRTKKESISVRYIQFPWIRCGKTVIGGVENRGFFAPFEST